MIASEQRIQKTELEQKEKIPVGIFTSASEACREVANEIGALIRKKDKAGETTVLGLATGSTPVGVYQELIRLHKEEGLSFGNVITFNLDEYFPIEPEHRESYYRFMQEQLFQHIDIPPENIHIPQGNVARHETFESCRRYEQKMQKAGGIDIQILGIGRTGHIGFNEPGSTRDSRTRLITLDRLTRRDAARDFLGESNVPRHAITMGVGTIMEARKVILMAWGEGKARIIARAVEGPVSDSVPATFLQEHSDTRFYIDDAASGELTRVKYPWLVGPVEWSPELTRRAVVWLAQKLDKPVLKLVDSEYSENGMADLLTHAGPAYNLNIRIFNELQHTITGWPGGKPDSDDTHRPERAKPFPKRTIIFSPEPQDDVMFMGGTLHRLVTHGHSVEVVYQTSGNLAVPDEDALKFAEFITDSAESNQAETGKLAEFANRVRQSLEKKGPFSDDPEEVRLIKAMIRRGEARAACRMCGVESERIHFLDLPFYEKGRYRQFSPSTDDIDSVAVLLEKIKPQQIYITGSLAEPSSIQAICFEIVRQAVNRFQDSEWTEDCYIWLYRGAQKEWEADEIEMAVPLSPDELAVKIKAIYQHESQRSQISNDEEIPGEAWQLAEVRNRKTANLYDNLGLAEYEAIEAFKRWNQ